MTKVVKQDVLSTYKAQDMRWEFLLVAVSIQQGDSEFCNVRHYRWCEALEDWGLEVYRGHLIIKKIDWEWHHIDIDASERKVSGPPAWTDLGQLQYKSWLLYSTLYTLHTSNTLPPNLSLLSKPKNVTTVHCPLSSLYFRCQVRGSNIKSRKCNLNPTEENEAILTE